MVFGKSHFVYNNYFENVSARAAITFEGGFEATHPVESGIGEREAPENCLIAFNTIIDAIRAVRFRSASFMDERPGNNTMYHAYVFPKNNQFENNIVYLPSTGSSFVRVDSFTGGGSTFWHENDAAAKSSWLEEVQDEWKTNLLNSDGRLLDIVKYEEWDDELDTFDSDNLREHPHAVVPDTAQIQPIIFLDLIQA